MSINWVMFCQYLLFYKYIYFVTVEDGKRLEKEVTDKGPGEGFFIKCDVSKEEDIKVNFNIPLIKKL